MVFNVVLCALHVFLSPLGVSNPLSTENIGFVLFGGFMRPRIRRGIRLGGPGGHKKYKSGA